jgi:arylsulfatase A
MNTKKFTGGALLSALIISSGCDSPQKEQRVPEKPNIIYILADDLGYGDLSFTGQEKFSTPNIDKLFEQGIFFSDHYSGSTVCAPSRSSLMTGLHTGNTPIRGNIEVKPEGQHPLPGIPTLASFLKDVGYATGAFGKWGLGFVGTTGDPNAQGFDVFYGYNCQRIAHRYYPTYLWHNDEKVYLPGNDWTKTETYAHDVIQEKTLQFIEDNKDQPFFLFVPSLIPHAELIVPEDSIWDRYKNKYPETPWVNQRKGADYGPDLDPKLYASVEKPRATFAAMVARLDMYVGQIIEKVEALGLAENTLIMLTSDNGPHQEGGHDPEFFESRRGFRGYKRDLYEGGIRVPLGAYWPGVIKPGTVTGHISAFWDILPTFSELAGAEVPDNIDGISFAPTLLGKADQQKEHEYLYWEFHERGGRQAVRMGNWKAVRYNVFEGNTPVELYDLNTDLSESNDLADQHPEIVEQMAEIMAGARTESEIFTFQAATLRGQ